MGFHQRSPAYQDSRGTILIVMIMALGLTLPSALVLGLYGLTPCAASDTAIAFRLRSTRPVGRFVGLELFAPMKTIVAVLGIA